MRIKTVKFLYKIMLTLGIVFFIQILLLGVNYLYINHNKCKISNNEETYILDKDNIVKILSGIPESSEIYYIKNFDIIKNSVSNVDLDTLPKKGEIEIYFSTTDTKSLVNYLKPYNLYYNYVNIGETKVIIKIMIKED